MGSRSRQRRQLPSSRQRFVGEKLGLAIIGKSCPICLNPIHHPAVITVCFHAYCNPCIRKWSNFKRICPLCKADFHSLFLGINLSSSTFHTKQLSPLSHPSIRRSTDLITQRRVIGRARQEFHAVNRRTRPLMERRSLGQSKLLPPSVVEERILQWRASIYERNLQAAPCPSRSSLLQGVVARNNNREMLLHRIEPWIRRELHAVLGDRDPSVLVHVVTSLFISSIVQRQTAPSGRCGVQDDFLEPLRPFLLERTNAFWHELRCFADSSFNMETYDTVVEYVKS